MMKEELANNINILGTFCGKRDLPELTQLELEKKYHFKQADVMVLFGGSILAGGDVLAQAMSEDVAKTYVIVGGAGHTTDTLRQVVAEEYPKIETQTLSEAEIFNAYLKEKYNVTADYLECRSTNCGNNITYLLDLLKREGIDFHSIILCQDATMQARMEAGLKKYISTDRKIINFAAYHAEVMVKEKQLVFKQPIHGMWEMERYLSLLMGEIPRLTDNSTGYGPRGMGYISHVEIPAEVRTAFEALKKSYGDLIRIANPLYASTDKLIIKGER
ncbi:YdcF family protein [Streptococcus constellatus]|nr:YdcF family protein [Streptococcus constellatus]